MDARMLRHARKEINWRANRIPHPFCLGLELLDYGLLGWDVFLGIEGARAAMKIGRPVRTQGGTIATQRRCAAAHGLHHSC